MVEEKKIGTSVKALINVGNYQNIEIAKYAETTISYETDEEMVEKENKQTHDLLESLKRDLLKTPEELNRYEDKIEEFKQSVSSEMPKWLGEGVVPNVADSAKGVKEKSDAKNVETVTSKAVAADEFEALISETPAVKEVVAEAKEENVDDLFANDEDLFED
jgi:hypothetical protein